MEKRNQKIIDAIIEKANRDCPGALDLIGIYGSCLTGDIHPKSDLDLMVLINDDRGYQLAQTFIQEDIGVGHDIYCTTWESLEKDALYTYPHISKLLDSKIIYFSDIKHLERLGDLRQTALERMHSHAAEAAGEMLKNTEHSYTLAMIADDISQVRMHAGHMINRSLEAIALLNGRYFRYGTKRVFEEIDSMEQKPAKLASMVEKIIAVNSVATVKQQLTTLMKALIRLFEDSNSPAEVFPGTYEEMFSNWRNKMHVASSEGDRYLSFMSLHSLDAMLREFGFDYDVLSGFDPNDLYANAKHFDYVLSQYHKEYVKAGIAVKSYPDIDAFIEDYLKKETA